MSRVLVSVVSLILVLATVMIADASPSDLTGPSNLLVVVYDYTKSGFVTKVGGRPAKDPLQVLSAAKQETPDVTVELLVHTKTTLSDVTDLRGIIVKAGFSDPQVFWFGNDRDQKFPLSFGEPLPLSLK